MECHPRISASKETFILESKLFISHHINYAWTVCMAKDDTSGMKNFEKKQATIARA